MVSRFVTTRPVRQSHNVIRHGRTPAINVLAFQHGHLWRRPAQRGHPFREQVLARLGIRSAPPQAALSAMFWRQP